VRDACTSDSNFSAMDLSPGLGYSVYEKRMCMVLSFLDGPRIDAVVHMCFLPNNPLGIFNARALEEINVKIGAEFGIRE
jgi:hypothetical protein